MKISDLLEYASSNPFVGLVSSIDLKIKQVEQATYAASHTEVFTSSLKNQLDSFLKLIDSATNWNIPEPKLKSEFHAALPIVRKHIVAARDSISSPKTAVAHLFAARKVAIARSHLKFGDIE